MDPVAGRSLSRCPASDARRSDAEAIHGRRGPGPDSRSGAALEYRDRAKAAYQEAERAIQAIHERMMMMGGITGGSR